MLCPLLGSAVPFMTTTDLLHKIPLPSDINGDVVLTNWMLDVQSAGHQTVLCPDILYNTFGKGEDDDGALAEMSRDEWKRVAQHQKVQGVVTDQSLVPEVTFSCAEVGLKCTPESLQDERKLLPWCCIKSYAHILQGNLYRIFM